MPSFGGLGKALAKEMNVEPEVEPETEQERELIDEFGSHDRGISELEKR